jgi:hypothetical protein
VVLYCHKLFLKHFSISSTFTLPGSYDWHLPLCKHLCSSCRTFISYMLLYFHLKILSVKQKHMFTPALHENDNTINFERIKINIRSLWSVSIMPCHSLYWFYLFFFLSMCWQVEFSASYSSACIRSSQQFPELSITYASSWLYLDY